MAQDEVSVADLIASPYIYGQQAFLFGWEKAYSTQAQGVSVDLDTTNSLFDCRRSTYRVVHQTLDTANRM
jgi:hypothetical protein